MNKNLSSFEKVNFTKAPNLDFLKRLSNSTGIIQHTKYAVPDRSLGYAVDDNSRALLVVGLHSKLFKDNSVLDLGVTYLSFIQHAKTNEGWFYNFLTFDNKFKNKAKTEDGFGRCLWALGYTVFANLRRDLTLGSLNLIKEIKPNLKKIKAPRAKAYCLAGLFYLIKTEQDDFWEEEAKRLADELVVLFEKTNEKNWVWFENYLTYANGIFPYSLALAYDLFGEENYLEIAKKSLDFLDKNSRLDSVPAPIGSNGWYFKGQEKAVFDQQPLEAADMVIAFLALYKITLNQDYLDKAKNWFSWYFGNNINQVEVYDDVTKGCFDALTKDGVNLNQGAESIITFLLAYLAFSDIKLKTGK